jgi:hypothetical protein
MLSFSPFEPVLLPRGPGPGEQSLGEYVLHAAASADVKVVRDPEAAIEPGATVRVLAHDDTHPFGDWIPAGEAQTGPDGWAHLNGVPVLRDLQFVAQTRNGDRSLPADGRGEPRGHLVIDSLRIPKPATLILSLKIKDSVLAAFPGARVMFVNAYPADPRHEQSEQRDHEMRNDEPLVKFESLKPGPWIITAAVRVAGNDTHLKVDEIELKAGETRRIDADLQPFLFQGRVTVGGTGVDAHVDLQNRSAPDLVRQHFHTRPDGSFYAVLPNPGTYTAYVALTQVQTEQMPAGDVVFEDPSTPVTIAVADPATVAVHVRAGETPAAHLLVDALHIGTGQADDQGRVDQFQRSRYTDAQGETTFQRLIPGEWVFSVRDADSKRGAEKKVLLHESDTSEVQLNLEAADQLRGTVHDAGGIGAPNAQVDCLIIGTTGLPARIDTRTDFDGKFSVALASKPVAPALCSVTTPRGVAEGFKATTGASIDIQLPAEPSALLISDWAKWYRPDMFWLAADDGRVIDLSAARQAIPETGPALSVYLTAGHWRVIRVGSIAQWTALALGQLGAIPVSAELSMASGKVTTIQIYGTPASAEAGNN